MTVKISKKLKEASIISFVLTSFFSICVLVGYLINSKPSIEGSIAYAQGETWESIGILDQLVLYTLEGIPYVLGFLVTVLALVYLTSYIKTNIKISLK